MNAPRAAGVVAHPTSFPGPHGIGDLGDAAFRFVDWLALAGQQRWQVLPLGPTGFGDSPYAAPSAFAGNPLLVSLDWLAGDGLLSSADLSDVPDLPTHQVDFGQVIPYKGTKLRRAFDRFRSGAGSNQRPDFETFCGAQAAWLDDYALFMAIKEAHAGLPWTDWDSGIALRTTPALNAWRQRLRDDIRFHQFVQFQFQRQWDQLRRYANDRGILIVGDLPIFVAHDSADVWANRDVFWLDRHGRPTVVAGVPPDAFSDDGQLWGNPLFDWDHLAGTDYDWWVDRVRAALSRVDILRIDHFRGFAAAWAVPASAPTAASGRWEQGPGEAVFAAIREALGDLPFLVEDLGLITADVVDLRRRLGLPGMKVLQFAFDSGPGNAYLPHNYENESVVYPGTHDNQTTVGWFHTRPDHERRAIQRYIGLDGSDIAWDLIRLALASTANTAIVTLQDVMRLGDEARMNTPGRPGGNWDWRYLSHQLHPGLAAGLGELVATYGRAPISQPDGYDPYDYTAPNTAHPLF